MFFKGSRYAEVKTLEYVTEEGRVIEYKATRLIGEAPFRLAHRVQQGERLDHISYHYYKDPERFWRLCDANEVLWPDDLVASAGERIGIPSSEE